MTASKQLAPTDLPAFRQTFAAWAERVLSMPAPAVVQLSDPRCLETVVAALALSRVGRHVVIAVADATRADATTAALAHYANLLGGAAKIHNVPEVKGLRREWIPENEAARCAALHAVSRDANGLFVASVASLVGETAAHEVFRQATFTVRLGTTDWPPETLAVRLTELDYDNELQVHLPGEFSRRGGIFDLFSPLHDKPVRLEYFGNQVDTMREFDPETQRSTGPVDSVILSPRGEAVLAEQDDQAETFMDYVGDDTLLVVCSPSTIADHLERFADLPSLDRWEAVAARWASRTIVLTDDGIGEAPIASAGLDAACHAVACWPLTDLRSRLPAELGEAAAPLHWQLLADNLCRWHSQGHRVVACCGNAGEAERFRELLADAPRTAELPIIVGEWILDTGVLIPDAGLVMLGEHELFGKKVETRRGGRSHHAGFHLAAEDELDEGCYAVHAAHGLCRYHGIRQIETAGTLRECLELEFAADAKLYVPLDQAHLVSRYVGATRKMPGLNRLGGNAWRNAREQAAESAYDLAAELIRLEAMRRSAVGLAFHGDRNWEENFAHAFPYTETEDQQRAIDEVLADMATPQPMDRLLCGDVGYGKTEVAMRAAFRAVTDGKQVAVLVPTTILAQQHYMTFADRMAEYPVTIEMLSRFRTNSEQRAILEQVALGHLDIVIGTHRLLQEDVRFADLGLLIIDEEQRFGVQHKEKLKSLRASVDILTMTATPIPRTLYFSLSGIRNLSTIMTPPAERLPVKTVVAQFDDAVIRDAILAELERDGQVFFLHNRVQTIDAMCRHLVELVPEARFGIGHGQMPSTELEGVMVDFLDRRIDVMVCTTIIESGLDIPNANTIIIDRADRFGLAELYQLRGRVGRYHHQAFAYLLLPPMGALPKNARDRLAAIRRYAHLGAGFKLALRDLEIRGSGNILGTEQSGHIAAIGFELYCELLREAVARLERLPSPTVPEVQIQLDTVSFGLSTGRRRIPAVLPPDYIPSETARVDCYQRLQNLQDIAGLQVLTDELRDRFGPLPDAAATLVLITELRIWARQAHVTNIAVNDRRALLRTPTGFIKSPAGGLPDLNSTDGTGQIAELIALVRKAP